MCGTEYADGRDHLVRTIFGVHLVMPTIYRFVATFCYVENAATSYETMAVK